MTDYRLLSNTFFYMLLCIRPGGISSKKPSQAECFRSFIKIVDPEAVKEYPEGSDLYSFRSYASRFRTANPDSKTNKYMNFGNSIISSEFERRLKEDTESVFDDIDRYFERYTTNSVASKKWLVHQLLALIEKDTSIGQNKFIVNPQFVQSYKADILNQTSINFYYFIAGMWLYVYTYNSDITVGKETLDKWGEDLECLDLMNIEDKFDCVEVNFDKSIIKELDINLETETQYRGPVFIDTNDIAPDLGKFDPENIIFAREGIVESESPYTIYLRAIRKKHYYIDTFIYENARKLDSFYVCNKLELQPNYFLSQEEIKYFKVIEDATVDKLPMQQRGIVISADGGVGKSMMLHHLVVDMVDRFDSLQLVPIFVTARLYDNKEGDFTDFIYSEYKRHNSNFTLPDMTKLFATGKAVIFIDGLDEIGSNYINSFMDELERFMDWYPEVRFVLSTRKHVHHRVISKFYRYSLQLFDIDQAETMVSMLDDNVIKRETKEDFIYSLRNGAKGIDWNNQREFLGNPLLLTIMLLAYDENYEMPTQRYVFYENAYNALAKKHDATKGLVREFKCGLSIKDFQLYFGEFCAATYGMEKYEFKEDEFYEFINEVIEANELNVAADDFIADIMEKLCLMYKDGEEYHFIHRSFQEYFTAYFFSKQDAMYYEPIYEMFTAYDESRHEDQVLEMLYGMATASVELHIIIPFLTEVIEGEMGGYWCFLDRIYPCLYFEDGECSQHFPTDDSESAIYNFIRVQYGLQQKSVLEVVKEMPYYQPMMTFYYVPEHWQAPEEPGIEILMEKDEIDPEYFEMYAVEPAGYLYEIPLMEVFQNHEKHTKFLDYLLSDEFPLKREYDGAEQLLKNLRKKYEKKPSNKSFISQFH